MLTPDGGPWLARLEFVYDLLPLMGGGAEQLIALVEEVRPRLMVIDTLTAVVKARRSGNSDVFGSQYQEVTRIRQIAETYGISVLLIHHTRKGGSDGVIESIAGTGDALNDAIRTTLPRVMDQKHRNPVRLCYLPDSRYLLILASEHVAVAAPPGFDNRG